MSPRILLKTVGLAEAACCLIDRGADDVARDYQFNSAVLLAARWIVVRGDWLGIAIALGCDRIGIDAGFDEVVAY